MKSEMTSRERLLAVLNHQEPDRVPIWMLHPREYLPYYADVYRQPSYRRVLLYIEKTDWLDRRGIPMPPFYTAAARVETEVQEGPDWQVSRSILSTPMGDLTSETRKDYESASETTTEFYVKEIADLEKILAIP